MEFRKHFDYDVKAASDEAAGAACPDGWGPSLTIQSQAEDADINVLMERFKITGQMPVGVRVPTYGDFENVKDYQSALHAIMDAQDQFMLLPADVRAKFDNDPQLLLEFASDPANVPELVKMGLGKETLNVDGKGGAGGADKAAGGQPQAPGREAGRDGSGAAGRP